MVELAASGATVVLRPELGGRVASITVDGLELLVTDADRPIDWGLFPMAPFAGRIRHGRLDWIGRSVQLPLTLPPHAIHGTLLTREWRLVDDASMEVDLTEPWPFRGRVRHDVALHDDGLTLTLTVEADEPMPAWVGWHPWFRRRLGRGARAQLDLPAETMFERDDEKVPTGRLVDVRDGPWDDCFTDLTAAPSIVWPEALALDIESPCDYVVVFTEPSHAVCVEPQSAPPDAVNLGLAQAVEPGAPLVATMRLRWRSLGG
ncbi:MAG TPA: hypothetical protein VM345_08125 [Acidimicrobiales bacterium]|nr:hypothetical protein [Acidimicrobiales bacterium]